MNSRIRNTAVNLSLAFFGVMLAVAVSEIALAILLRPKKGAEFENLEELHKTLRESKALYEKQDKTESVPMAAVVTDVPDDRIIYELRPNLDVIFTGVPVRTNESGMRGPAVTKEKPAGTFRIGILGDSYAFGWGVNEDRAFGHVLEELLNARFKGSPRVEVLNFAVPGYSTFQQVAAFERRWVDFNPDAVLVFFVDNDFDLPFLVRDFSGSGKLVKSFSLFRLGSKAFHPGRSREIVAEKGLDPNTMLAEFERFTSERNIRLFLAINPAKGEKKVRKKLTVLKKHPGIHLIEMRESYRNIVNSHEYTEEDLNLPRDEHPSPLRHRIYGELLVPAFEGEISITH